MADAKYPIRFSIDFPHSGTELSEYQSLTMDTLYRISKSVVENGGQITTTTYFQNGEAEEAVLSKVSEIYDLFNKQ